MVNCETGSRVIVLVIATTDMVFVFHVLEGMVKEEGKETFTPFDGFPSPKIPFPLLFHDELRKHQLRDTGRQFPLVCSRKSTRRLLAVVHVTVSNVYGSITLALTLIFVSGS